MDAEVRVERVDVKETRSGSRRFVLRDADGNRYTTFRPQIGEEASKYEGRRVHITYHQAERDGFMNIYLDAIGPAEERGPVAGGAHDTGQRAW